MPPHRRLLFEPLESRQLLAVDLTVVDVQFVDPAFPFDDPTSTPVAGQKIALRAEIDFNDLNASDLYDLRFDIDGVAFDTEGIPGDNTFHFWVRNDGWVALPNMLHEVTVTIDPGNTVIEMDESNNTFTFHFTPDAPTSLPQKFINPLAGIESVDWFADGYVDLNPEVCPFGTADCSQFFKDYRGNPTHTRDFHNGIDFRIINFAQADRGVDVLAAADGMVTLVQDGNFDRRSKFQTPVLDGNRVFIDHGDGWVTQYYHLQRDSVAVNVGDQVTAGQVIGKVGSSGNSLAPHLHFEVQRNHSPVEPFVSPNDYFVDPPDYAYDTDPVLHDLGITTAFPFFRDITELPSDNDAFPAQSLFLFPWVVFSSIEPGDTWEMKIFQPDGTEFVQPPESTPITFPTDISGSWQWNRWRSLSLFDPEAGNWRAEVFVNGTSVGEEHFIVGRSLPELRVIEDENNDDVVQFDEALIIDGRRTPLDFGEVVQSSASPTKKFFVENHGFADLTISSQQLPAGFSLVEPLDATIAMGGSDTFTVAMDTSVIGQKSGTITIVSNDRPAADLAADGDVDGADFLDWQRGVGIASGAMTSDGDANGDGAVGADDLFVWQKEFGSSTETTFEFHLEGEVTAALAALTAPPAIPAFDEALLGRFVEAEKIAIFEHTLVDPAVVQVIAATDPFATQATLTPSESISARRASDVDAQDDFLVDSFFNQLGLAAPGV